CSILHLASGAYRRLSSVAAATLVGSKSNEWTRDAPSWIAARENSPLPEPMSSMLRPVIESTSIISRSDRRASARRLSSTDERKLSQFFPNSNRSPRSTCRAYDPATIMPGSLRVAAKQDDEASTVKASGGSQGCRRDE